ncbi:MAG: cytochrome c oxidase subunit II [Rhodospirillaceae bacterium]|nr:MAG: cytochrome c oxidase subunit II [Rhodospirillaceae bacterium]
MAFGRRLFYLVAFLILGFGANTAAMADQPKPWQFGFQDAVTPVMEQMNDFHNLLLVIITAITIFVFVLLGYVLYRFSAKRNPVPSRVSHNTPVEVIWTLVPILILIVIAIPSFRLLYFVDRVENADITIKAVGHQWYWSYVYPDADDLTFDSFVVEDDDLEEGQPRLLATDSAVVVPVNKTIRVLVTATDVLHAWAVPAFGVKIDGVPGRLNETWFRAEKEGTYYGQCSELCGTNHGMMPITVKVVSQQAYEAWLKEAKEEYAIDDTANRESRVARINVQQ